MHLNHLNLRVDDLAAARAFFEQLLDFQFIAKHGNAVAVMTDGAGFTLVLSASQAFGRDPPRYPEGFHVGFLLDTPGQGDATHARLVAAGIDAPVPRKLRGPYTCYFTALGTLLFEVSCPRTDDTARA